MVRVISVHHFTRQDVAGLERSGGRGVTRGKGDILLVGGEHSVDIRDLKLGGILQSSFPTVDLVHQLVYCETGNFVVTLETKPARHGGDHRYVRVYLHWDQDNTNQPMRARIAGRVTPSSQSGVTNLEMVEIPLRKPAEFIACCQSTGNIAVACGISVTVFKFCQKTHDISKIKFIDFEELIELDMAFIVKEVAISEDLIGCVSESEAHIFQITINSHFLKTNSEENDIKSQEKRSKSRSKSKTRSASRSPGRSIESLSSASRLRERRLNPNEECLASVRDSDDYVDLSELTWVPTLSYGRKRPTDDDRFLLFPSLVGAAQCGPVAEPGEKIGPVSSSRCSSVRLKLVSGSSTQKLPANVFEAVTLIHRQADHNNDPDIPFSNLKLMAVYDSESGKKDSNVTASWRLTHPLLPSSSPHKVGASIFLTTPHVGQLYHVTLFEDAYKTSVVRGGVFSYTAPVYSVALEPSLLHALTLTGLETYTLRPHPHIVVSHLPEDLNMIVPPHWEETVCLVGLRPFLNVETLTLTDSCLALIAANNEGGDKSHTVYSLHLPSAASLYKEMVRVGRSHRSASPSTYLHLLLEAHLVLTTALHHEVPQVQEAEEDLYSLLQDSSALLGDYYAQCDTETEWKQATQYYQVSSLSPDAVIERLDLQCPGLAAVISAMLLHPNTPVLTSAQANCVLEMFEKAAPDKVSTIILKSSCLIDYKKDKVLGIIKQELSKTTEPRPTDVLALALVFLDRGSPEQVSTVLASLRAYQLVVVLLQHTRLLLTTEEGETRLSPLTQVLAEHKKEVFTEVFVSLIGEGTLTLNAFVDAFVAVYPIVSCGPECNTHSLWLRDFLEKFFLEYAHNSEITDKRERYDRAITVLVSLYLASLMGAFGDKSKEDPNWSDQRAALKELYAPRPIFLGLLPPFSNDHSFPESRVNETEDGESSEGKTAAEAEEDGRNLSSSLLHLVVLQSLLSSDLPSVEDRNNVLKFVTSNPTALGAQSLRVLCLEPSQQLDYVLQEFPHALLQYGKDMYKSPLEWEELVSKLINHKSSLPESDPSYQVYYDILNDVLGELVVVSPLEVFLRIIPSARHEELRGHIRQCHSAALALHLRSSLMTYAHNVLAQMTK
ncbi:BLOC-2 complex member HPS3 isoform X2 [Procambarus clarkii]|nr:Hermansky-Pudlak syndrome 3 protein-like isoform X2 [Procambarus clarkii]XP_045621946.1 Hermansky-Pudlak syndrome 3 protein-like isoform X2 [Procambarus clarkii]XP_045621947.1 Hermansky-Pudlak syndrome 3 protein-like isoform X2 [Procambarus clarkii]